MKKFIFIVISFLVLLNSTSSQVEFGTTGSFWNYDYSSHNGNGGGWDVILIEGDTIIDSEIHKILRGNYYRFTNIPFEENYGSFIIGTMQIVNDSVFVNNKLILDFGMEIDDSLALGIGIQLAIDSILIEEINGYDHKKWFGQKICLSQDPYPYEEFVILENVGQIGFDYLLWNIEGCFIGGGTKSFICHGNGDFTYPPNSQCVPFMLVNTEEIKLLEEIRIYPNPSLNLLNIENNNLQIQLISVYDFTGREILQEICNSNLCRLNIESLIPGIYIVEIETTKGNHLEKFIKK